jgi:hypothetical protein
LNIEAFAAPVIIPLSGLLLIQMQKRREEELLMHPFSTPQTNPVNPLGMLLCNLFSAIIIITSFYFIIGCGHRWIASLTIINCLLHLYQFLYQKSTIKEMHQQQLMTELGPRKQVLNSPKLKQEIPPKNSAASSNRQKISRSQMNEVEI